MNVAQADPYHVGQYLSPLGIGAAVAAWLTLIPVIIGALAGLAALIFYCITIYESHTVQQWMRHRKAVKLRRLELKHAKLVQQLGALGVLKHSEAVSSTAPSTGEVSTKRVIETTSPGAGSVSSK